MQRGQLVVFALALGPCGLAVGAWACSGDTSGATAGDDASGDSSMSAGDALTPDSVVIPSPDASSFSCQISPSGPPTPGDPDPVLLCSQQTALGFLLANAYKSGTGVMSTWSASMPYAAGSVHRWQDDVGLAAAIGDFHCSSEAYGNNITTGTFDSTLPDLAGVLTKELSPVPSDYDGAIYFRLHSASLAYSYVNDSVTAPALNAVAEAYARAIQTTFTGTVTLPVAVDGGAEGGIPDGSAADGSSEAAAGDAGPNDAGTGGGTTVTLIGTPGTGGTVAYEPAKSVMAAAALLDMARLHVTDGDAGADVATWEATALGTLAYVWARGRDPVTGLFYASLVTSSDPGHDALGTATPANDVLLTDVQGPIVLGLARAYSAATALSLAATDAGLSVPNYPAWGNAIIAAMSAPPASLFDGIQFMSDAGDPTAPAPPGAFLEGYVPSTGATLTNKTVLGNALLFAGSVRTGIVAASPLSYENNGMRWALSETVPASIALHIGYATTPWPANTNLYSVIVDNTGQNVQQAFLRASSKAWGLAQVSPASGTPGDAGLEPGATDYRTDANLAFIEALTQLWLGFPNAPACVY